MKENQLKMHKNTTTLNKGNIITRGVIKSLRVRKTITRKEDQAIFMSRAKNISIPELFIIDPKQNMSLSSCLMALLSHFGRVQSFLEAKQHICII